jgi:hypothetical protein
MKNNNEHKVPDAERIRNLGHRAFVGGDGEYWENIGKLQFNYLAANGLKPENVLLDVACGSLRAGRYFIKYLDYGNYMGIDKEVDLIILGVSYELGGDLYREKAPQFVVSDKFEFQGLLKQPDYIIAHSLFTHLTSVDIFKCLSSLRLFIKSTPRFYATFFETSVPYNNNQKSDSLESFFYTKEEFSLLADLSGWKLDYIGEWEHPRGQKIVSLNAV